MENKRIGTEEFKTRNGNKSAAVERQIEPYLGVLSLNNDDQLLLGASNFGGILWTGSLWLFNSPKHAPDTGQSIAGLEMDVAASDAMFYDETHIIAADYSGKLLLLLVGGQNMDSPIYFTRHFAFPTQEGFVTSLDCAPTFRAFVAGYSSCSIILWDIQTHLPKITYSPAHRGIVSGVRMKPDSDCVFASSSQDGDAIMWDTRVEKPASHIEKGNVGLSCIEWLDGSSLVFGDYGGYVRLFDARNQKISSSRQLSSAYPVQRLCVNEYNKSVAVAIDEPSVHVISSTNGSLSDIYSSYDHTGLVRGLAWSKITGCLYSCGWDTQVLTHEITQS